MSDKPMMKDPKIFKTADGVIVEVGKLVYVRHQDGDYEEKRIAEIVSSFKVRWDTPDSRGYEGARHSVVYYRKPVRPEEDLKKAVQEFFELLDITEESESGKKFHPVRITCVRTQLIAKGNAIVERMRDLADVPEDTYTEMDDA